ncbi:hypothetical protein LINPERHAP1_LOCUS21838 [Linum perenne]
MQRIIASGVEEEDTGIWHFGNNGSLDCGILPLRTILRRRRIHVPTLCGLCGAKDEMTTHMFGDCEVAGIFLRHLQLWEKVQTSHQPYRLCTHDGGGATHLG